MFLIDTGLPWTSKVIFLPSISFFVLLISNFNSACFSFSIFCFNTISSSFFFMSLSFSSLIVLISVSSMFSFKFSILCCGSSTIAFNFVVVPPPIFVVVNSFSTVVFSRFVFEVVALIEWMYIPLVLTIVLLGSLYFRRKNTYNWI